MTEKKETGKKKYRKFFKNNNSLYYVDKSSLTFQSKHCCVQLINKKTGLTESVIPKKLI